MNENETNTAPLDVRAIVEGLVGTVEWISEQEGYVRCPGMAHHTQRSGPRDCKVYLDKVPTLTCFHGSCRQALEGKNRELRRALAGELDLHARPHRATDEERAVAVEVQRRESVRRRAAASRIQIIREHQWPVAMIIQDSPDPISSEPKDHWRQLLALFQPEDVVWIGSIYDSGKPQHMANFRSRDAWMGETGAPAAFTCPSTFKSGSSARANEFLKDRRFLVVESDTLPKDEVGSIFQWMRMKCGMVLRAVVDTGGKSLHGWFDFPSATELPDLRLVLPELGCDPKLFTASQPVRLPGAFRVEKNAIQRLIFLNGKGVA